MYSQPGRPGPGRGGRMQGRYMKGRLPEGVDFSNYPGRSSTPLPTAESKSAERINQLKIWNEAATNDDKRRLHTAKSKQALVTSGSSNRRTDSFKDARERHSASFQEKRPSAGEEGDMFADRSDSESEEGREELPSAGDVAEQDDSPSASPDLLGGDDSESPESSEEASPPPPPEKKVEDVVVAKPITEPPAPKVDPVETVVSSQQAPIRHPVAKPVEQAHAQTKPVPKTRIETGPGDQSSNQPKRSKGCCVIQ